MLKKLKIAALALLLPLIALAQSYPSPTLNNLTVNGTLSVTGAPTFKVPVPVASGGTGGATITAHGVMLGEGTGNIATVGPCATTGQSIISQGASADPICGYPTGALIGVRVFTSSGTYTPTPGTNSIVVFLAGGGGGGGGASATSSQGAVGGGGGSGALVIHRATTGFSGQTITIGAAGAGGAAGANAGGAGGNSTFAGLGLTANGGGGGATLAATAGANLVPGGSSSTATGGNIANINGQSGDPGQVVSTAIVISGAGGVAMFGTPGSRVASVNGSNVGTAAAGFGAGGSGGGSAGTSSAQAGGNGAQGVCIIYEYS